VGIGSVQFLCEHMFVTTLEDPRGLPLERLESEITELAAHVNAATCRWLCLVGEFDRREAWGEWGCKTCAAWLSWRCGLGPAAAREQLRVARCLAELPAVREVFGRGELSYSQVRALTRIATAETEADLVELALHATASQLEVIVRAYRGVLEVNLGGEDAEHRRRFVRCEHDDDGSLLISARLPAEEGALVMAALEAGRDALRSVGAESASAETTQNGDTGERAGASNADALVLMANSLLASGPAERPGGDRHQVVVHVEVAALTADDASAACQLEQGSALHPETARRLACDASLVRIIERDGRPLSVGRKTRSVPPALRRALHSRDRTCRFPGCSQRRFLHAHHIAHWARGGRTDLANLIQLCAHHHRLVHEGGYRIERRSRGELCFRRPDGLAIAPVPARNRGDTLQLARRNRRSGLDLRPETCVPYWHGERLQLDWVASGLAERDPRLRE
jgi:hypothetical protein